MRAYLVLSGQRTDIANILICAALDHGIFAHAMPTVRYSE